MDKQSSIARIKELESERKALAENVTDVETELRKVTGFSDDLSELQAQVRRERERLIEWDEENGEELKTLLS